MESKYLKNENFTIVLDSRNATTYYNSTFNSEVTFEMKYPIIAPKDCLYMTWCVQSFTCPVSWYLINSTNNLLSITMNSMTYNISIPYGNYNATNFQTVLLSLLPSGFSISINAYTNIYTMTHSIFDFTINSTSTIYQIMGLYKGQSYSSTSKNLTLPYTCNFSGLNSINIICENIRTNNLDSRTQLTSSNIIATIPINNAQTGVIFFQKYNYDYCFDVKDDTIDYLDILIIDDLGNQINFNNQHWNLTIQINYYREIIKPIDENFNDILAFGNTNIN